MRGFLVIDEERGFGSVLMGVDLLSETFFFSSLVEDGRLVFFTDCKFEELPEEVFGLAIGIVIVSLDCLLSFVDEEDEIGLVLFEIFLISVFVLVDEVEG